MQVSCSSMTQMKLVEAPKSRRRPCKAVRYSSSASTAWPLAFSNTAKLLRLVRVSGLSGRRSLGSFQFNVMQLNTYISH